MIILVSFWRTSSWSLEFFSNHTYNHNFAVVQATLWEVGNINQCNKTANIFLSLFQIPGVLAAVDATKEQEIGKRYKIEGFPTGEKTIAYVLNFAFPFLNASSVNHNSVVLYCWASSYKCTQLCRTMVIGILYPKLTIFVHLFSHDGCPLLSLLCWNLWLGCWDFPAMGVGCWDFPAMGAASI